MSHLRRLTQKIRISYTSLIPIRTSPPWTNLQPRKAHTPIVCFLSSSLFFPLSLWSSMVEFAFLSSPYATTGSSLSLSLSHSSLSLWRGSSPGWGLARRFLPPRCVVAAVPSSMVYDGSFLHGMRLLHGSRRLLP
jgi:hypothetical protein